MSLSVIFNRCFLGGGAEKAINAWFEMEKPGAAYDTHLVSAFNQLTQGARWEERVHPQGDWISA